MNGYACLPIAAALSEGFAEHADTQMNSPSRGTIDAQHFWPELISNFDSGINFYIEADAGQVLPGRTGKRFYDQGERGGDFGTETHNKTPGYKPGVVAKVLVCHPLSA